MLFLGASSLNVCVGKKENKGSRYFQRQQLLKHQFISFLKYGKMLREREWRIWLQSYFWHSVDQNSILHMENGPFRLHKNIQENPESNWLNKDRDDLDHDDRTPRLV